MVQRRIVTLGIALALIVLGVDAGSSRAQSTSPSSTNASELRGAWRGWFNIVGGDADRQGDLALEINDDATYTLSWTRKGTTSKESGGIVANGSRVGLRSTSGQQMTLVRNGDTLYGLSNYGAGGHPIQVMLRRATASDAPPSTLPRFDRDVEDPAVTPAPYPLEAP
jgi:hypothetical protein